MKNALKLVTFCHGTLKNILNRLVTFFNGCGKKVTLGKRYVIQTIEIIQEDS
jgi:hypothetical protein